MMKLKARLNSGEGTVIKVGSEPCMLFYPTGRTEWNDWEAVQLAPHTFWDIREITEEEYEKLTNSSSEKDLPRSFGKDEQATKERT